MANTMAAILLADKDNEDAQRLRAAVSLRNAPKTSWKSLCLSSCGGGADKFRSFISEKAASDDPIVACIARTILSFFLVVEARFVKPGHH